MDFISTTTEKGRFRDRNRDLREFGIRRALELRVRPCGTCRRADRPHPGVWISSRRQQKRDVFEIGTVIYANSVFGARSNFESGPAALAAALTGRTPEYGFHLDDNRKGTFSRSEP